MTNLTSVTYASGAIAGTTAGTVSTLDNLPNLGTPIVDGVTATTKATVKAASTAAAATDPSFVTNESPNSQLSATTGVTTGAAVITDANGTLQQYLRGLVKLFAAAIAGVGGAFFSKITDGTGTATIGTYGTAPGAVGALNVNANVTNALSPGRNTPANSAPVVLAKQDYQDLAASTASTAIKGQSGASGASGDWLDFVLIIPETTAAGTVTLQDGTNTAINIFVTGTLASLVPFAVPIRANSANGAWKISTGANVHVRAVGNFT